MTCLLFILILVLITAKSDNLRIVLALIIFFLFLRSCT